MTTRRTRRTSTSRTSNRGVLVKVAKTGGAVTEVYLDRETGFTVEDALSAADLSFERGQRIRVGGRPADLETTLKDGDVVVLSGSIKGGN